MEQELIAKRKWILRLELIATKAGEHAEINEPCSPDDMLSEAERSKLRQVALARGAFRTMAVHIGHFERFMQWCSDHSLQALDPL